MKTGLTDPKSSAVPDMSAPTAPKTEFPLERRRDGSQGGRRRFTADEAVPSHSRFQALLGVATGDFGARGLARAACLAAGTGALIAAGGSVAGPRGAVVGMLAAGAAWLFLRVVVHATENGRAETKALRAQVYMLSKELRYLTDLAVNGEDRPPLQKGVPLSEFGRQRFAAHQKVMAFARAFEASRIRELYLEEIYPDIGEIKVPVGAINEFTGHPNKVDMLYVCAVAEHIGAKRIFEFGTYRGRTTYHLARIAKDVRVTTLNLSPEADPVYGPYIGKFFKGRPEAEQITQVFQDSRAFDAAPYRGEFDLVFVDGDHSYELVKNDTLKAFELVRKGGVILWHDYSPKSDGLVKFFQEFTQERPLFRIKRTCVLLHRDGVDPMSFTPAPVEAGLEKSFYDKNVDFVQELYHL
jgi:predicted O-methyltransferase YrrM